MNDWNKPLDQNSMNRRAQQKDNRSNYSGIGYLIDGIDMFIPGDGENKIRVVPPLEIAELNYYGFDVKFHRNMGPIKRDMYICLTGMYNKPCARCEMQTNELWETDRETAKACFPDHRVLMWVLDLKAEQWDKLLLWSCAIGLADDIMAVSRKRGSDTYIDISDPNEGRIIYFDREGKGLGTKYKRAGLGDDETLPLTPEIAAQRVPFQDLLIVPSYEEVKAAIPGPTVSDAETPPVSAYQDDIKREADRYDKLPQADTYGLNQMSREELMQFKVNMKVSHPEEFGFGVYKSDDDEMIRVKLFEAIALTEPPAPAAEPEPTPATPVAEAEPEPEPAGAGANVVNTGGPPIQRVTPGAGSAATPGGSGSGGPPIQRAQPPTQPAGNAGAEAEPAPTGSKDDIKQALKNKIAERSK